MNESIGKCTCGGTLRIQYHNKDPKPARAFRWEVYCDECLDCPKDRYSSREKAIVFGLEYFCAALELDLDEDDDRGSEEDQYASKNDLIEDARRSR